MADLTGVGWLVEEHRKLMAEADALRKELEEARAITADYEREIADLKKLIVKTFNEKDAVKLQLEEARLEIRTLRNSGVTLTEEVERLREALNEAWSGEAYKKLKAQNEIMMTRLIALTQSGGA